MFIVSEEATTAIRAAYEQDGELSAAIEVRRLFPGITDNAGARECARTIAGWKPLPAAACQIIPLRLRRSRARPTGGKQTPAIAIKFHSPLFLSNSGRHLEDRKD
jgi:hypothetical protein